jgi:hypothetical protein
MTKSGTVLSAASTGRCLMKCFESVAAQLEQKLQMLEECIDRLNIASLGFDTAGNPIEIDSESEEIQAPAPNVHSHSTRPTFNVNQQQPASLDPSPHFSSLQNFDNYYPQSTYQHLKVHAQPPPPLNLNYSQPQPVSEHLDIYIPLLVGLENYLPSSPQASSTSDTTS